MSRGPWGALEELPVAAQALFQVRRLLTFGGRLFRAIRRLAGEQAEQDGTKSIDVPAGVGHRLEIRLFRGHVEQGAEGRILFVREPRLAEIRQARLAVLVEEDVCRLQIAMQNALGV